MITAYSYGEGWFKEGDGELFSFSTGAGTSL